MSCPPRIWNGLYNIYLNKLRQGHDEMKALQHVAQCLELNSMSCNWWRPHECVVMDFAKRLAITCEAHFVESYGTTEVGAIAEDSKPRSNVSVRLRENGATTSENSK